MGTGQSRDQRNSTVSVGGGGRLSLFSKSSSGNRPLREHKRHGVVTVRINSVNNNRRNSEGQLSHVITPKGAILYGSLFNPAVIQNAIAQSHFPMLTPGELPIMDSRAHKLFVTYCQGWHIIPFPEVFSRHAGTCYVVGDRNTQGVPFQIKVGDCFRLGSVGLVVSEMKIEGEDEQRIDAKTLQFLKDEALAFDTNEDLALLASDEMQDDTRLERESTIDGESMIASPEKMLTASPSMNTKKDPAEDEDTFIMNQGLTNGEKYICYMCYETHNTAEDPLIAPCDCRGDTRFLHVQCLQRWYHSSSHGSHAQVIRTTGNGAPACKICGAAYKTNFRRHDGRKASILEMENDGPYMSLVVVTHHDTNPGLFNTKFRLNFGRRSNMPPPPNGTSDADLNRIEIGRSSSCTMILDYRTVSTKHAEINYSNGKFYLSDKGSSNGTMVYIRDPLPLPYSKAMKIRMGRTTITLQARRAWTAAMRSLLFGGGRNNSNDESLVISANTNSTPTVSVDGNVVGGALPPIFEPTPVDLQHFLATLHMAPGPFLTMGNNSNGAGPTTDKIDHGIEGNPHMVALMGLHHHGSGTNLAGMNFNGVSPNSNLNNSRNNGSNNNLEGHQLRNQTIRTINDAGSVEGDGEGEGSITAVAPSAYIGDADVDADLEHDDVNYRQLSPVVIGVGAEGVVGTRNGGGSSVNGSRNNSALQSGLSRSSVLDPSEGDCTDLLEDFRSLATEHQSEPYSNTSKKYKEQPYSSGTMKAEDDSMQKPRRISSPCPGSPPHLVAGNSASIVVMNNIEDKCRHLLVDDHSHASTDGDRRNSQQKELQDNMFNSLPVAGVFAIPGGAGHYTSSGSNNNSSNSSVQRDRRTPTPTTALSANNSVATIVLNGSGNNDDEGNVVKDSPVVEEIVAAVTALEAASASSHSAGEIIEGNNHSADVEQENQLDAMEA